MRQLQTCRRIGHFHRTCLRQKVALHICWYVKHCETSASNELGSGIQSSHTRLTFHKLLLEALHVQVHSFLLTQIRLSLLPSCMNKVADFSAGNYTIGATKRGEVWSWGRFQASRESVGEAFFNELFRRCFFNAYFRPPTFRDSLRTPGVALGTEMKPCKESP